MGCVDRKCAKFASGGGKKSKFGDSAAVRKQEDEGQGFGVLWAQELENRIPGLRGGSEDEQVEGFKELVKLDVGLAGANEEEEEEELD